MILPRTFVISEDKYRDSCLSFIRNIPTDGTLEVIVRKKSKARGIDQNSLYWVRLTEIAEQAHVDGRQYSKEVLHEYCRQTIMPVMVELKTGEVVSKWLEMPSGDPVVISTSLLSKKSFAEYVEAVEAFGVGLGVMFSENPSRYD